MNAPLQHPAPLPIPPMQRVIGWLTVLFCCSFLFDFRGEESGGSAVQYVYLLIAVGSTACIALLGFRTLLAKPGVYLLALWFGYLVWAAVVATLNGVSPNHSLRILLPPLLCGCGILVAHVAACHGVRARTIVTALLVAAVGNILWRFFYGFAVKGATVDTARAEILSPALDWIIAFVACSLVLDRKLKPSTLIVAGIVLVTVMISVTRAVLLPIAMGGIMATVCLGICLAWRALDLSHLGRKAIQAGVAIATLAGFVIILALSQPAVTERWVERLFYAQGGKTTVDASWLTRKAEAKAMWDILSEEPISFVYGKGVGAGYHWDSSFYPELYLVYPADFDFSGTFHFAGHSVWTYALFSGGVIGVLFHLGLFAGIMVFSIAGARAALQSGNFHPAIAFLPFVAAWCALSQSATSNLFDERLAGLMLGLMAGLPQVYFYQRHRQAQQIAQPAVAYPHPQNPVLSS
ncbi:MAG: hypothetical protein AAGA58_10285 [Verrucomicrobiota bacterium]